MRFDFMIYQEGIKRIKNSGIEERVKKLKSRNELDYIGGFVSQRDIAESVKDLATKGYYKHIPEDFKEKYKKIMNEFFKKPEKFYWTFKRHSKEIKEECELEDVQLFTGEIASIILKQRDIWDFKKFGFSSATEFISTLSAYIIKESREGGIFGEGYKWLTKRGDNSEILTEITGDSNCDLRIIQTDVAPYPTFDPFGNQIFFRPETQSDKKIVAAYHSTESSLLIAAVKYIDQQKIKTSTFDDRARKLIEWSKTVVHGSATCAEHFGGFEESSRLIFVDYKFPIPMLDENYSTKQRTVHALFEQSGGAYCTYISHNGNLVLSHEDKETAKNPKKRIIASFLPQDMDDLIKGIFYQCARGLGRTSLKQVINLLEYRFSDSFGKDIIDSSQIQQP